MMIMMRSLNFAIFASLLLSGVASPSRNANKMRRRTSDTRIVNGEVGCIESMPYMVSLQKFGNYFCGGSILNACFVLTSAGCVVGKDTEELTIRAGSSYINESGSTYPAESIVIHPKFSVESLDYNVALVKTKVSMEFDESVKPISVAEKEPALAEYLTVAGWGELEEGGGNQPEIHLIDVQVANKKKCAEVYENMFILTERMICTYRKGVGTCHGDNGGPAVYNNKIVGVISHRMGCGVLPDIHANTADPDIRDFIMSEIKGDCM